MERRNISSGYAFEDVYGYSRAVQVGNQIYVSGTSARPPYLEGCDAYEQARAALSIVETALREVGATLTEVVRTCVYIMDIGDASLIARAHHEVFGQIRPTTTMVVVSAFLYPEIKVEIEAYAVKE